jgi:hypothetical protein
MLHSGKWAQVVAPKHEIEQQERYLDLLTAGGHWVASPTGWYELDAAINLPVLSPNISSSMEAISLLHPNNTMRLPNRAFCSDTPLNGTPGVAAVCLRAVR